MRKYVLAYSTWLLGVLTMAAVALAWYRHVEGISYREVLERLQNESDDGARTTTE
jgi:hypothetical protein